MAWSTTTQPTVTLLIPATETTEARTWPLPLQALILAVPSPRWARHLETPRWTASQTQDSCRSRPQTDPCLQNLWVWNKSKPHPWTCNNMPITTCCRQNPPSHRRIPCRNRQWDRRSTKERSRLPDRCCLLLSPSCRPHWAIAVTPLLRWTTRTCQCLLPTTLSLARPS